MVEGARISVQVSRIERDPAARKKCMDYFGTSCSVCGFDFGRTYGALGNGFIHVHHLQPLAATKGKRKVDPKIDFRPVCPNCHEMLHKENPPLTIEALKAIISAASQ
jgi:5-methylcytosine-specific restriction enzyme A